MCRSTLSKCGRRSQFNAVARHLNTSMLSRGTFNVTWVTLICADFITETAHSRDPRKLKCRSVVHLLKSPSYGCDSSALRSDQRLTSEN